MCSCSACGALRPLLAFVAGSLAEGRSVLVYCFAGMHRSGAAVVAAIMFIAHLSYPDALNHVALLRPVVGKSATPFAFRMLRASMCVRVRVCVCV